MNISELNSFGKKRKPFLFISDFEAKQVKLIGLDELDKHDIDFSIDESIKANRHSYQLKKFPISYDEYKRKFDSVIEKIKNGDTYLLNLTQATPIKTKLSLKEIFHLSNAHYKLRYKDEFVCFSPEKFIQIKDNTIHTFPMKGTIDASLDGAQDKILQNNKEISEHVMVVDLLRNDLSIVAKNVKVEKFRYITKVKTTDKELLQVSSHISGSLDENWHENIGNILKELLPAGSISGTPKKSTLGIIKEVEGYDRGFYTGVFGVYDGQTLDSGVMIRFIERKNNILLYKSGGGITLDSDATEEYNEMCQKVYLA